MTVQMPSSKRHKLWCSARWGSGADPQIKEGLPFVFGCIMWRASWDTFFFSLDGGVSGFGCENYPSFEVAKIYGETPTDMSDLDYDLVDEWEVEFEKENPLPSGDFDPQKDGVLDRNGKYYPCGHGQHDFVTRHLSMIHGWHSEVRDFGTRGAANKRGIYFYHSPSGNMGGFFYLVGAKNPTKKQIAFMQKASDLFGKDLFSYMLKKVT